jgi:dephospho-CoA kinase
MRIAGLTGGIGSGKTTVCRIFEQLGIPVFYADDEAKALYTRPEVIERVAAILSPEVVDKSGAVDRRKMAAIIFSDAEKRAQLNAYVHPLVRQRFAEWMLLHENKAPYCIREAAILIESGAYKDCDPIILVTADEELRIRRVMERDNTTYDDVKKRIQSQMSDEERKAYADFIIYNNGESLIAQVMEIHRQILSR